jgi:hypothetical protein
MTASCRLCCEENLNGILKEDDPEGFSPQVYLT